MRAWADLVAYLAHRLGSLPLPARSAAAGRTQRTRSLENSRKSADDTGAGLRLEAMLIDQWLCYVVELARRINADHKLISYAFADGEMPGRVALVAAGMGDPHDGGRTVTAITFECGLKLVYKPRPVGLLRAWGALLHDVEPLTGLGRLTSPALIDRGTYGWVAWVPAQSRTDHRERALFARRLGVILALADVVGASDLHLENLGELDGCPVILDAETLLRVAWTRTPAVDSIRASAFDAITSDGVVRTGMIPRWQNGPAGPYDASAAGALIPPTDVDHVVFGLRSGYRAFLRTSGRCALERFMDDVELMPVRAVVRPTSRYDASIHDCLSGLQRAGIGPEDPAGGSANSATPGHGFAPIESESLVRLDIPRVEVRRGQQFDGLPQIDHEKSLVRYVRQRHASLNDREVSRQESLVTASFALRDLATPDPADRAGKGEPTFKSPYGADESHCRPVNDVLRPDGRRMLDAGNESARVVQRGEAIAAAERIGRILLQGAIRRNGALLWITCRPVGSARRWQLAPGDFGLYDGNAGTVAFFAALWACTLDERWRNAATEALRPVVDAVAYRGGGRTFVRRFGIGGAEGLGGVLYGLALTSMMLDEDAWLNATHPDFDEIETTYAPGELLYGLAGLSLGATAAYDVSGRDIFLSIAMTAARRLLNEQRVADRRRMLPIAVETLRSDGFAHGTAGAAAALLLASRFSADESICDGAWHLLQSFTRSREHRDSKSGASPQMDDCLPSLTDGREKVPDQTMDSREWAARTSWCSGAAGEVAMWMAADRCLKRDGRAPSAARRRHSVRELVAARSAAEATMCCGIAGRLDILLQASIASSDALALTHRQHAAPSDLTLAPPLLRRSIQDHVTELIQMLDEDRRLPGLLARRALWPYSAGLYRGIAGIGYALLRYAEPDRVPSPLCWDLIVARTRNPSPDAIPHDMRVDRRPAPRFPEQIPTPS